jgi:hypothetical protein
MGGREKSQSPDSRRDRGLNLRPRVVILSEGRSHVVEVLELPDSAATGDRFSHDGTTWRVTGLRRSSRVLIAEPA